MIFSTKFPTSLPSSHSCGPRPREGGRLPQRNWAPPLPPAVLLTEGGWCWVLLHPNAFKKVGPTGSRGKSVSVQSSLQLEHEVQGEPWGEAGRSQWDRSLPGWGLGLSPAGGRGPEGFQLGLCSWTLHGTQTENTTEAMLVPWAGLGPH